ncbi:MAG TPA: hypothetical protein VFD47_05910 [Actinomycetota bacterium]|nr:hypothetical protein [Actinomycetota bacterium]
MSVEERLRTQLEHAATSVPVVPLDFEETLAKGRRARRVAFARAAGAAAIVIGLGIAGATTVMNREAPRPIPPVEPSPTVAPPPTEQEIESTVRSWLQAIQDGDEDAAWALMTEGARAEVGREQFDELMTSALPEGLGAFADPGVDIEFVEVETPGGNGIVATMSGSVQQEGPAAFGAETVPLRVQAGTPLVDESFEVRDEVLTVWASASLGPEPFRAGKELDIEEIPSDIERVYLSIDGAPAQRAEFDEGTGSAVVTLARTLDAGLHLATIVMIDGEGRMFPNTRPFEAAAP